MAEVVGAIMLWGGMIMVGLWFLGVMTFAALLLGMFAWQAVEAFRTWRDQRYGSRLVWLTTSELCTTLA